MDDYVNSLENKPNSIIFVIVNLGPYIGQAGLSIATPSRPGTNLEDYPMDCPNLRARYCDTYQVAHDPVPKPRSEKSARTADAGPGRTIPTPADSAGSPTGEASFFSGIPPEVAALLGFFAYREK